MVFEKISLKTVGDTIVDKLPSGLTFYKDFTASTSLTADYSIGSPTATFTNISSNTPVFDSNGISLGTARDDVLSYPILNNRTAAQETIVIKFTPATDFANDGVARFLTSTDTKTRDINKSSASTVVRIRPNSTDSTACSIDGTTTLLANNSYVVASVAYGPTADVNAELYINKISEGTDSDNYTTPVWGNKFYIGSTNVGTSQAKCSIAEVAFFNRALTAGEILAVSNIFNQ
jgi:hypothetical protein